MDNRNGWQEGESGNSVLSAEHDNIVSMILISTLLLLIILVNKVWFGLLGFMAYQPL